MAVEPVPVATRRHALLLGHLTLAEADAHFAQLPITPVENATPAELWRQARQQRAILDAYEPGEVQPLPTEVEDAAAEVRRREAFARYYANQAEFEFAMVPIDSLLVPQAQADMEYVSELAYRLPDGPEPLADFAFAFPVGSLAEPMLTGQVVSFTSFGANMAANPVPTVQRRPDGSYDISVRATSRPNYVQVARYGGRLVLTNGVHKVLALRNRGRTRVSALVRMADRREELGLNLNLSLHADASYLGARPPLVRDFLAGVAVPVLWRSTYSVLRVLVQVDQFVVPAVAAPAREGEAGLADAQAHEPVVAMVPPVA